jgi:hypothetical protein
VDTGASGARNRRNGESIARRSRRGLEEEALQWAPGLPVRETGERGEHRTWRGSFSSSVSLTGSQSGRAVRIVGREDNGGFLGRELLDSAKRGFRDRRVVGHAIRLLGP